MKDLKADLKVWIIGYLISSLLFLPVINYIFHSHDIKIFDTFTMNILLLEVIGFIVYFMTMIVVVTKHAFKR